MKKFVVAGMVCLAAIAGTGSAASATTLFGWHLGERQAAQPPAPQAPIVNVQSGGTEMRVQQLEEQMRQLNGRIEEMSYQLLQMQETLRKNQEDNEFRFQSLEKGGAAPASAPAGNTKPMKKSEAVPPAGGAGGGASGGDDVAGVINQTDDLGQGAASDAPSVGQPPRQLGSIQFDQKGNPVGGGVNPQASVGSGPPPNVDKSPSSQTASLGSENDQYKAAYNHVIAGDYPLAEREFTQYIQQYPSGAKAAEANYWLGEALYSQGKYNEAAKTFLNAHQKYAGTQMAPEMLLKLGMSLAALDNTETACATLREVTKRYPKASKAVTNKVASEQKRLSC
ncbi:tol-pal system protein YbgF [Oryzifoliimicrobium ureilyticus]|uniref:tol-pal system protein YbgF n=1 Tax=Oryzifoliimicrobium ureilyticus TaxID=3113724 RepID=UPI003075F6A9